MVSPSPSLPCIGTSFIYSLRKYPILSLTTRMSGQEWTVEGGVIFGIEVQNEVDHSQGRELYSVLGTVLD